MIGSPFESGATQDKITLAYEFVDDKTVGYEGTVAQRIETG